MTSMVTSPPQELEKEEQEHIDVHVDEPSSPTYTLHKQRFVGVLGLVILNIATGLNWPWFSAISTQSMIPIFRSCVFALSNAM